MSVATIQPPAAIYREEQFFAWWLYALLAVMVGVGWLAALPRHAPAVIGAGPRVPSIELPVSLVVGLVLPPVLVVFVLRMTTEVTPGVCRVWFGFVPSYRRGIPLEVISRVEVVTYRPFRDHWFWGVRTTRTFPNQAAPVRSARLGETGSTCKLTTIWRMRSELAATGPSCTRFQPPEF